MDSKASETGGVEGVQEALSGSMEMQLLIAPVVAARERRKHSCEEILDHEPIKVSVVINVFIKSFPLALVRKNPDRLKDLAPKNRDHSKWQGDRELEEKRPLPPPFSPSICSPGTWCLHMSC